MNNFNDLPFKDVLLLFVHFNNNPTIIWEPIHLVKDLHQARMSNFIQKQLDKCRMETLLIPIFTNEHRLKILKRNLSAAE